MSKVGSVVGVGVGVVDDRVTVRVIVFVGVTVGEVVFDGVLVGVTEGDAVLVGVLVGVGVKVGVTLGVGVGVVGTASQSQLAIRPPSETKLPSIIFPLTQAQ